MSGSVTTFGQGIDAAAAAEQSYNRQAQELAGEVRQIESDSRLIHEKIDGAVESLVDGLLPNANPETVEQAVAETGALSLPGVVTRLGVEHSAQGNRRDQIEADPRFQKRDLLGDAKTGQYTMAVTEANENIDVLTRAVRKYDSNEDFQWFYARQGQTVIVTLWMKFVWLITFGIAFILYRNEKDRRFAMMSGVLAYFEKDTLDACYRDYESCKEAIRPFKSQLDENKRLQRELDALSAEHAKLVESLGAYGARLHEALRKELRKYLNACEQYAEIHKQIRASARITIATIMVLKDKLKYLQNMRDALQKEVRDRQTRAAAVSRVAGKWRKAAYKKGRSGRLKSDKSKWLIDGPQACARRTTQRMTWINTMHTQVVVFDDYYLYDRAIAQLEYDLLTYDFIYRTSDIRLPYDGFACQIIPDVADWRQQNGEESPDYTDLNQFLKTDDGVDPSDAALAAIADGVTDNGSIDDDQTGDDGQVDDGQVDDSVSADDMTDKS